MIKILCLQIDLTTFFFPKPYLSYIHWDLYLLPWPQSCLLQWQCHHHYHYNLASWLIYPICLLFFWCRSVNNLFAWQTFSCGFDYSLSLSLFAMKYMKVYSHVTNDKNKRIWKLVLFTIFIFIHPCKIVIPYVQKIICKKYLFSSYKGLV